MKKKSSKELLFERMHYVAGMPKPKLNEGEMDAEEVSQHIEPESEEKYDEASSYQVKLDKICSNAEELHEIMKDMENLPAWVQDKITIADHNMEAIRDWVESKAHDEKYDTEPGEEPEMDSEEEDDVKISDEDMAELNEGKDNVPKDKSLWDKAIKKAKEKYDVYPSAYANAWASKWYKEQGGEWKKGDKDD